MIEQTLRWILDPTAVRIAVLVGLLGLALWLWTLFIDRLRRARHSESIRRSERDLLAQRVRIESSRLNRQASNTSWSGFRKFIVSKRTEECDRVMSFDLEPHDRKPIPGFEPGQYLTFRFQIPDHPKPIRRCYSLTQPPGGSLYRITVKRLEGDQPGLVSSYLHSQVREGDLLDVMAPRGQFILDPDGSRPLVFIAGGIGVTPLFTMLRSTLATEAGQRREIWFFYGARNSQEQPFKAQLESLALQHENLHLYVCYSRPRAEDKRSVDYHLDQRISIDLFKKVLPSNNFLFMICGPESMMSELTDALRKWRVPKEDIHTEAFAAASVRSVTTRPNSDASIDITFSRSGRTLTWQSEQGSILDFAEANEIPMDSGCRAGNCGACSVAIRSGGVTYLNPPGAALEEGTCLACIAVPETTLTLDA